ncbi:hypothetical protein, conserved, partial [Trypanosoma cruzi]
LIEFAVPYQALAVVVAFFFFFFFFFFFHETRARGRVTLI